MDEAAAERRRPRRFVRKLLISKFSILSPGVCPADGPKRPRRTPRTGITRKTPVGKRSRTQFADAIVDPASAAGSVEHKGRTYYFCSTHLHRKFQADPDRFTAEPLAASTPILPTLTVIEQPGRGTQTRGRGRFTPSRPGQLYLPHAPGDRERPPRFMPDLRDGAGTDECWGGERRRSRAARHEPPVLDLLALTVPLRLAVDVGDGARTLAFEHPVGPGLVRLQFLLAAPVVLWGGLPFFKRGWRSVVNRNSNMFTPDLLWGPGRRLFYSAVAAVSPGVFPESFRVIMARLPSISSRQR